jgi:hypothetical protein
VPRSRRSHTTACGRIKGASPPCQLLTRSDRRTW